MHSDQKQEVRVHIRWMIRRDMPEVLAIEDESFEFPWLEEDFIRCLRQRNCIGMVAEHEDRVVGFMIYELHKTRIHVLNFAVAADYQPPRRGQPDGRQADRQALVATAQPYRAGSARDQPGGPVVLPRERIPRRLRACASYYDDTPEDAYLMQYRYRPDAGRRRLRQPDHPSGGLDPARNAWASNLTRGKLSRAMAR